MFPLLFFFQCVDALPIQISNTNELRGLASPSVSLSTCLIISPALSLSPSLLLSLSLSLFFSLSLSCYLSHSQSPPLSFFSQRRRHRPQQGRHRKPSIHHRDWGPIAWPQPLSSMPAPYAARRCSRLSGSGPVPCGLSVLEPIIAPEKLESHVLRESGVAFVEFVG